MKSYCHHSSILAMHTGHQLPICKRTVYSDWQESKQSLGGKKERKKCFTCKAPAFLAFSKYRQNKAFQEWLSSYTSYNAFSLQLNQHSETTNLDKLQLTITHWSLGMETDRAGPGYCPIWTRLKFHSSLRTWPDSLGTSSQIRSGRVGIRVFSLALFKNTGRGQIG